MLHTVWTSVRASMLDQVENLIKPKDARFKVPTSATGEKRKQSEFLDPEEKRPKFIIIGSTKCSTSALLRNAFQSALKIRVLEARARTRIGPSWCGDNCEKDRFKKPKKIPSISSKTSKRKI